MYCILQYTQAHTRRLSCTFYTCTIPVADGLRNNDFVLAKLYPQSVINGIE